MFGSSERLQYSCSDGVSHAVQTCINTHLSDGQTASLSGSSSLSTSRPVTARSYAVVYGVSPATSTTWARDSFPCQLPWYSATSLIPGLGPTLFSSLRCSPFGNVMTTGSVPRNTAPISGQSIRHGLSTGFFLAFIDRVPCGVHAGTGGCAWRRSTYSAKRSATRRRGPR